MKFSVIVCKEPAGIPPEHTISIRKADSPATSMDSCDYGVILELTAGFKVLVPWGNIRHAIIEAEEKVVCVRWTFGRSAGNRYGEMSDYLCV